MNTIEDFIYAYQNMRNQQKKYFRLKLSDDLEKAKKLEKELDTECEQFLLRIATSKQESLFQQ